MIERLLKERLVSLERFNTKLDKDILKLHPLKSSTNEILIRNIYELEALMLELADFLSIYKAELANFLIREDYEYEKYRIKFDKMDAQMLEFINLLQEKEAVVNNMR